MMAKIQSMRCGTKKIVSGVEHQRVPFRNQSREIWIPNSDVNTLMPSENVLSYFRADFFCIRGLRLLKGTQVPAEASKPPLPESGSALGQKRLHHFFDRHTNPSILKKFKLDQKRHQDILKGQTLTLKEMKNSKLRNKGGKGPQQNGRRHLRQRRPAKMHRRTLANCAQNVY